MKGTLASVVRRAAARLRLLPVLDHVTPDSVLTIYFDPADRKATTAAITALAHAVEDARPRALVRLPLPQNIEYAGQDRAGRVRVLRVFNPFPKDGPPFTDTRMCVGIAK